MAFFLSVLVCIPKILSGFCIAQFLWRENSFYAMWLKLFLGVNLGMGLWSLLYFLWLWIGWNRFIFPWVEITVSILTTAFLPSLNPGRFLPSLQNINYKSPAIIAVIMSFFTFAALFNFWLRMHPHGYEDAWFIWNLKSRFIYFADNMQVLFNPGGPGWHADYPLLISLNNVSGWVLAGQVNTYIPMVVTTLFTFSLPGILFFGLSFLKNSKQAALACIGLLSCSIVLFFGASQEADIAVSSYVLASLTLLAIYLGNHEKKILILVGLTTCLTGWAKNEGFLFILVVSLVLICIMSLSGRARDLKYYFIGAVFPLGVVLFFKFIYPVPNDLFRKTTVGFLLDFSRYTYIIENLAREIANLGRWTTLSLPGILFAYTLLVGFDHSHGFSKRVLGVTLLLQLAGYFFIYVLSPHDLVWHMRTSQERLLLHLFPSGLMLLFYSLKTPNFNFLKVWKNAARH